jgi:hypothetical protein
MAGLFPNKLNRFIHRRGSRDTIEIKQLIRGYPKCRGDRQWQADHGLAGNLI